LEQNVVVNKQKSLNKHIQLQLRFV